MNPMQGEINPPHRDQTENMEGGLWWWCSFNPVNVVLLTKLEKSN